MTPARILTWFATLASLMAAGASALPCLDPSKTCQYDANVAVLTATLIAIIWYTAFTWEALHYQRMRDEHERLQMRTTIGAALMAELRWLDDVLAQVVREGPYVSHDMLSHPVLDLAISKSEVFSPEVAHGAALTRGLVNDVRVGIESWAVNPDRIFGHDRTRIDTNRTRFAEYMTGKAILALQSIALLVEELKSSGVAMPVAQLVVLSHPPANLVLPESPFGGTRQSDAQAAQLSQ